MSQAIFLRIESEPFMPNTLVHIVAQGPVTSAIFPRVDLRWILLGTIIPDIPWILRRLITFVTTVDGNLVSIYASLQSSFLLCILLSAGISLLTTHPLRVFWALFAAVVGHLLLDMVEIKPGNGVLWLVPFSLEDSTFSLVWPEHWFVHGVTLAGSVYALFLFSRNVQWAVCPAWPAGVTRSVTALILIVTYLAIPAALVDRLGIRSLGEINGSSRVGQPYYVDRMPYRLRGEDAYVLTNSGDEIRIVGTDPVDAEVVSLSGVFIDENTVVVEEIHVNDARFRDYASFFGLLAIVAIWCRDLIVLNRRGRHPCPTNNAS